MWSWYSALFLEKIPEVLKEIDPDTYFQLIHL
jgi:hypothetical protein